MKNNDKYVEAKKYLQKRYPKELSDKRWNTSDINDDWVTEMMTDFASQSKPQEIEPNSECKLREKAEELYNKWNLPPYTTTKEIIIEAIKWGQENK